MDRDEVRKHNANDPKCRELGWVCIPLAVESYGCWGEEAHSSFSCLAARLALQLQYVQQVQSHNDHIPET